LWVGETAGERLCGNRSCGSVRQSQNSEHDHAAAGKRECDGDRTDTGGCSDGALQGGALCGFVVVSAARECQLEAEMKGCSEVAVDSEGEAGVELQVWRR